MKTRKINLTITGCLGRMGQQLIKSANKDKRFKINSLTENKVLDDYPHLKNYAKTNIVNSWRINYRSWLNSKLFRRITIRYEDMVKDPTQTFEKLVVFVNTLMRFDNKIDQKKLINAIDTTNFKSLQNIENVL